MALGGAFGLQVLELRMRENGRLHSFRARRFIEVLQGAHRGGNYTVHLLYILAQRGLISAGPVFAFIEDGYPVAQAARLVQQAKDGEVTGAKILPTVQARETEL